MIEQILVIRHGETQWSSSGRHTGRTDLPLTTAGEAQARRLGALLQGEAIDQVLVSPLRRARQTCEGAGLGPGRLEPALLEWDYGDYEGLTSQEIRQQCPSWDVFRDGCPRGEAPEAVGRRADELLSRLRALDGRIALVSHGHFLRVLAARWCGLPVAAGRQLALSTASLSRLGWDGGMADWPAVLLWNRCP